VKVIGFNVGEHVLLKAEECHLTKLDPFEMIDTNLIDFESYDGSQERLCRRH